MTRNYEFKCKVPLSAQRGPEETMATIENLNFMTALRTSITGV